MSWLWKIAINHVVIRSHKCKGLSTEKHLFHWSLLKVGVVLVNFNEGETQPIKANWPISCWILPFSQAYMGQRLTQQHDG